MTIEDLDQLKVDVATTKAARRPGLFQKFRIERTDGRNEERDQHARYFVLNYVGDSHARAAYKTYAYSVMTENPTLALEMLRELEDSAEDYKTYGVGHRC